MVEQLADGHMVLRLGDTSGDYYKWRAEVWAVRELPEYKMRKLWKLNFSAADIAADKHWAVYPPNKPVRERVMPGARVSDKRGRTISDKKINWIYARALREAAENVLQFYRLDTPQLERVRKERDSFVDLVKRYAHKKA